MISHRWHIDSRTCSHSNEDVCPTCDFDDYYRDNFPDCPWRETTNSPVVAEVGGTQ